MSNRNNPQLPPPQDRSSLGSLLVQSFRHGARSGASAAGYTPFRRSYVFNPIGAVARALANTFDFSGTASRAEMFWHLIFTVMVAATLYKPMQDLLGKQFFLVIWLVILPLFTLFMRRLREMGWSPILAGTLLVFFPAGALIFAIALVKPPAEQY